jgi:hypothetical protein
MYSLALVNFHISGIKRASPGTVCTVDWFQDNPGHSWMVGKPTSDIDALLMSNGFWQQIISCRKSNLTTNLKIFCQCWLHGWVVWEGPRTRAVLCQCWLHGWVVWEGPRTRAVLCRALTGPHQDTVDAQQTPPATHSLVDWAQHSQQLQKHRISTLVASRKKEYDLIKSGSPEIWCASRQRIWRKDIVKKRKSRDLTQGRRQVFGGPVRSVEGGPSPPFSPRVRRSFSPPRSR